MMRRQLCDAVCHACRADWLKTGCLFGALIGGFSQPLHAQSASLESTRRRVIVQRVGDASATVNPTLSATTPEVTGGFAVPTRPIVQAPVVLPSAIPMMQAPVVVPNTQPMDSANYWAPMPLDKPGVAESTGQAGTGQETEILKLRPQFLSAVDLAKALSLAIGEFGALAVMEEQGVVLVAGPKETLERAVRMLEQVDVLRPQVRITMYLFDVKLETVQQLGLAAAAQLKAQAVDAAGRPITDESADNASSRFHVLSTHLELPQAVRMLNESGGAKMLADPELTVVDRQTTSFNVVTRIPLSGAAPSKAEVAATVAFEEAGVKLAITPRVLGDSIVELQMAPEYSTLAGFNNQGSPVIEVRRAQTNVRAIDGQTVVIGGLRRQMTVEAVQGVPGLMNWKVVGPLFRTVGTELTESELICIVRPQIVSLPVKPAQPRAHSHQSAESKEAQTSATTAMASWSVQSGAYQVPVASQAADPITPSAYRPSVYQQPTRPANRNINGSRNSVTQPSPFRRGG